VRGLGWSVAIARAAVAVGAIPARAQTRVATADLAGVVRDASAAVLAGATVTVRSAATNAERSSTTNGEGRFVVPALAPGAYDVTVALQGFSVERREGVVLALGTLTTLDVTLGLAGVAEQVTVVGEVALVDPARTVIATSVTRDQINALPIDVRNFISFAVIAPGVTTDRTPQQGAAAASGLTFAGQRARSNNITVDGLDNNDVSLGGVRATFSQEAVQEFQVLTHSYSAEFGKASGGVLNIVTRSGTNEHAGSGFVFFRDESLNAREHFERFSPAGDPIDRGKAPYSQIQAGGVLGGPIRRDRTFYFLSYERLDIETNNFVTIDDSSAITLFGNPIGTTADIFRRAGFPIETGNVPYRVESNQVLAKVDHRLGGTDSLSVRFNWADGVNENVEPWGGQVARSRGGLLDSRDVMLAASHVAVLTPDTVNELRVQVAHRDQTVQSLDPQCGGVCDSIDEGGPTVEVSGVASAGRQRFTPQPRASLRVQVVDTYSRVTRRHNLKAGVDFSYVDNEGTLPAHFGGRYIFAPLPRIPGVLPASITSIQALALGLPAAYVQGYGNPTTRYSVSDLSLFVQDDWSVRPNLSIKAGLRYQRQFWPDREYNARGLDPYSISSDGDNVAPRLAIAWNPTNDPRTSVHASYGIYYDNHITSVFSVANLLTGDEHGIRTQVARFPASVAAWNAPGRQLPEGFAGAFPSLVVVPDPILDTPFAHHASAGLNHQLSPGLSLAVNAVYARGFNQLGTLDYNPIVPALGAGRRPEDTVVNGTPVAGTSASVLQYTTFGETWYRALIVSLERRYHDGFQFLASYTLSKAEDNSTDFHSAFVPQNTGAGRNPADPTGLPVGFEPNSERGPALHDQRHRLVLSGLYDAPGAITVSAIVTAASGWPFNVLAGVDLDGNGDGGAFPADRARTNPADPSSSVGRNTGRLPAQATVDVRVSKRFSLGGETTLDALVAVFNLFNRTNFTEVNGIFGTGAYPSSPSPTFGQYEKAASPRQVQIGLRLGF
jgi:hypothetical protein